jgi:hypothetical protein
MTARSRAAAVLVSAMMALPAGCSDGADEPDWVDAFGYSDEQVFPFAIGDFGFPYVQVAIDDDRLDLPFDTGNTIGVMLSTEAFDRLGLAAIETHTPYDSAGRPGKPLRTSEVSGVSLLGRDLGPGRVFELGNPNLDGLVGPVLFPRGHITFDYGSKRLALGDGPLPDSIPGYRALPLIRSASHPSLILVRGSIEGRPALLEIDTGKSRCVVNPDLSADLGLARVKGGVVIEAVQLGALSFAVPRAKEVDQGGIDPGLPQPILAGIGSDLLSRFVWTVDYDADLLWVPESL